MYKFISLLITVLFISISQVSYAQCCKCFNSPIKCSTECNHDSGHSFCGCDGGCNCGPVCGSGLSSLEVEINSNIADHYENILNFVSIDQKELYTSASILKIEDDSILNNLPNGNIEKDLFLDSYFADYYGFLKIDHNKYIILPVENDVMKYKSCDEELIKIRRHN